MAVGITATTMNPLKGLLLSPSVIYDKGGGGKFSKKGSSDNEGGTPISH